MKRYECKISGLDCADCANKIQEELSKNPELENVSVSFAKQKIVYETEKVSREENKKIDDEWLKKVNTTMNLISSNSNDFRSVSEVVSSAKKAAAALPKRLKEETKC